MRFPMLSAFVRWMNNGTTAIFIGSLALLLVFVIELREALGDARSITPALTPNTIELISYREFGYRFKIIPRDATPPTGFEQPGFNEDAFGFQFAFGSFGGGREGAIGGGDCPLRKTVRTSWPSEPTSGSQLLVRRVVTIPPGVTDIRIMVAVDNDIVGVFFDGRSLALPPGSTSHGECPILDEFRIDVSKNLVQPGQHLVAFHLRDRPSTLRRANESFFDTRILAELPAQIEVPIRWCGVKESPSMMNPAVVRETSTNGVLLQRLARVNEIYIRQANMSFRSGATPKIPDFPIFPDPNTSIGAPGDFTKAEASKFINQCKEFWWMKDPTSTGTIAVHINRIVEPDGTPSTAIAGFGDRPIFSDTESQLGESGL